MSDQQEEDRWEGVPLDQRLIIWQRELEQHRNELEQHRIQRDSINASVNAAVTFAGAAIKGLLIINGGAAVAIIAFLGHLSDNPAAGPAKIAALAPALIAFGWGALLGAMVAALAYLSQLFFSQHVATEARCSLILGEVFRWTAVAVAAAGYVVFAIGLYTAVAAFQS
jgi:hypothetical protein